MTSRLQGEISFIDDNSSLALDQIRLLTAIDETGSISAAAKKLSLSYKTAWERLERLNNLSPQPLVNRSAGGSQGGGSQLTPYGKRIILGFSELQQEHTEFINKLSEKLKSFDDISGFIRGSGIVSSARNQFLGTVVAVEAGAVNAEIVLQISEEMNFVAIITEQSRIDLGVTLGAPFIALIKASSVMLTNNSDIAVSARNKVIGKIARIEHGKVNADVTIELGKNKTLNAVVTSSSIERLELAAGAQVCAFFKASSVILMRA